MRIIFFGTPEFAIPSLNILIKEGYAIVAVVTAPDKPRGRGQKVSPPPVKEFAIRHGLRILQPENLKDEHFIAQLKDLSPDLMVVVAYRILPPEVYTIPPRGAFNLHASLLPKYRGAAPIHWAIIQGETETGVTTFFLEQKVDTGSVIMQARCPIKENETAGELHDRLADIGAEVVLYTVRLIEQGKADPQPQDESLASRAPKLTKEMCRINWTLSARQIHNHVRGLSPSPAAYTYLDDRMIKIIRTEIVDAMTVLEPGTVQRADEELHVATGNGVLRIIELQREGKKPLDAAAFLRGTRIQIGDKFYS